MSIIKNLRAKIAQNLPRIEIEGETFYVRPIKPTEYAELVDDCMAFARVKTSEALKGTTPNPMKVQIVENLLKANPEIKNLLGAVDVSDAYSVAIAHAVVVCFAQMQCARALTTEDGCFAFPEIEDRIELVDVLLQDEAVTLAINDLLTVKEEGKGNDSPEA